jgi:hypothetical protein
VRAHVRPASRIVMRARGSRVAPIGGAGDPLQPEVHRTHGVEPALHQRQLHPGKDNPVEEWVVSANQTRPNSTASRRFSRRRTSPPYGAAAVPTPSPAPRTGITKPNASTDCPHAREHRSWGAQSRTSTPTTGFSNGSGSGRTMCRVFGVTFRNRMILRVRVSGGTSRTDAVAERRRAVAVACKSPRGGCWTQQSGAMP